MLAGRSCNRNVARPFRACRFMLRPAANAVHSKLLRVVLSVDHCVAFEMAFHTVLVGSHCRNFEVREIVDCVLGFQTGVNGVCRLPGLTDAVPSEE